MGYCISYKSNNGRSKLKGIAIFNLFFNPLNPHLGDFKKFIFLKPPIWGVDKIWCILGVKKCSRLKPPLGGRGRKNN
jgi:hypothetical protein